MPGNVLLGALASGEDAERVAALELRLEAAIRARSTQYVMLHLPEDRVPLLSTVFHGLAAPTVLPLAGRDDIVAAHIVVQRDELWSKLGQLARMGATGIVALQTDAILALIEAPVNRVCRPLMFGGSRLTTGPFTIWSAAQTNWPRCTSSMVGAPSPPKADRALSPPMIAGAT